MRTAIYTRVSSDIQVEEGFSLDAQLHRLRAYCESQGWTIADVYTDEGISAKNTHRPQLQRMLDDIRERKIDVVLVYRLDRLTRSVIDLHELLQVFEEYNVSFKSATEVYDTTTAMGRLFITIVAALAQWERENLGERTRFGQAEMVRQGRYFGHTPPYGYDLKDGRLYINPIEAKVIRTMFDRYFAGDGVSRLVKFLNDPSNNMPRPRGSDEWSQKVVNACIKNPVYCGYVRYGNTGNKKYKNQETVMAKSDHEPIIDEFQWRRAQMLMEQRRIIGGRSGTGSYPLVGVLRCGNCGGPMIGHTVPAGKNGRINPYFGYLCNARRHKRVCTMKMWKRDVIEPAVISEIERIAHEMIQRAKMEPEPKDTQSERINIEAALFQLKQRRKKWMDAFDKEFISGEDLRDRLNEINQEEEQLRSLKQEETNAPQPISLDDLRDVRKTWDAANDQERKELIRSMVETAWVNEDGSVRVDLRMVF